MPFLGSFRNRRFIGAKMEAFLTVTWWLGFWCLKGQLLKSPSPSHLQVGSGVHQDPDHARPPSVRGQPQRGAEEAVPRVDGRAQLKKPTLRSLMYNTRPIELRYGWHLIQISIVISSGLCIGCTSTRVAATPGDPEKAAAA